MSATPRASDVIANREDLAQQVAVVPWQPEPPIGEAGLTELLGAVPAAP